MLLQFLEYSMIEYISNKDSLIFNFQSEEIFTNAGECSNLEV